MISVVIPAYNAGHVIEKCLCSLQNQSYSDFECIVVDDASTDDTRSVIDRVTFGDERFSRVDNSQNVGPSRCRNIGIKLARGEYIYFLDADDWVEAESLSVLINQVQGRSLDYCFSAHNEYIEQQRRIRKRNPGQIGDKSFSREELFTYVEKYLAKPCEHYGLVHCWGRIYRRSIISGNVIEFDSRLSQMEDVSFNFKYLSYCNRAGYVDQYLYTHRIPAKGNLGSAKGTEGAFDEKLLQAIEPVKDYLITTMGYTDAEATKKLHHFYSSMVIVSVLRMSRVFFAKPTIALYQRVRYLIRAPITQIAIRSYRPSGSDSKSIGVAIRYRLTSLTLIICLVKRSFRVAL